MDDYIRQALTISVAQICNNIGWHSITDSSMNILTDILNHYISDLSVTSKKYAEHAYGDVPDIEDIEKAFRQKNISLTDLRRYLKNTGPVKFPHSVPPLNDVAGRTVLNAIKPGSREIVTRPIHVHEHLPTLNTESIKEEEQITDTEQIQNETVHIKQEFDEVILHKRLREISSVVMTSSGFLSPSREGRLADSKLLPFPEIKIEPLESPQLSEIATCTEEEPPQKITISIKKDKSKKLKANVKNKLKNSKKTLLLQSKEQKPKVVKIKKPKEEKMLVSNEPPELESNINEINAVPVTESIPVSRKVTSALHINKTKMEEVLPKFSFFGPLPPASDLVQTTFSQPIIPEIVPPEKVKEPASPIFKIENEDISRKGQKKKKKDKKKEKKEKKKQKDKLKQKENEKKKEKEKEMARRKEKEKVKDKLKSTNKVPKIKFRFGNRETTITKVLPVEKPPEENVSIIPKTEPMEIIESIPDIPIDILRNIKSPPRVPIQKIKTKIVMKTVLPTPAPAIETSPPAFYFDEAGNQVWICPMCTKPDDGSPMIGCDGCDVWYHWVCVGIQCPPDCAVWYCPRCLARRAQPIKGKRGRPRKSKY